MRVIDADTHIIETAAVWEHLDASERQYKPQALQLDEGIMVPPIQMPLKSVWVIDGALYARTNLEMIEELRFPHSLGLLYSAFTYYCGFKVNSGEYKLMGLAPYGEPVYADLIKKHLIDIKPDGSYRMAMEYFNYCDGLTMTGDKFAELFGGPARKAEADISKREMDLAASVQVVTEEIMLKTAQHIHKTTGMKNLVLAGGVALNCVANGKLLREAGFDGIWVQPAAGDAGGAPVASDLAGTTTGASSRVWPSALARRRGCSAKRRRRACAAASPESSSA